MLNLFAKCLSVLILNKVFLGLSVVVEGNHNGKVDWAVTVQKLGPVVTPQDYEGT